jgi:hypothetical protein
LPRARNGARNRGRCRSRNGRKIGDLRGGLGRHRCRSSGHRQRSRRARRGQIRLDVGDARLRSAWRRRRTTAGPRDRTSGARNCGARRADGRQVDLAEVRRRRLRWLRFGSVGGRDADHRPLRDRARGQIRDGRSRRRAHAEHGARSRAPRIVRGLYLKRGAALRAPHLEPRRRHAALVHLVRGPAARALDLEHRSYDF